MQTLKEKLKEDLKVSWKSGESVKKDLIRVILGEISLEEKSRTTAFLLDDEGVTSILKKAKKNHELTKEGYEKEKREVPDVLFREMEIIDSYLPKQLSEEQIKVLLVDIVEEFGECSIKDMGKIMAKFNAEFPGQADGKIVAKIVKEKLSGQ